MTFSRASTAYRSLGGAVFRRVGTQTRTQAWRQATRRSYASGPVKKSSDIPWIIGSAAFTIPAAVWLFGQGPKKSDHHSDHGHGHEEKAEEKEEPAEEESEAKEEEAPAEEDADKEGGETESKDGDEDKAEKSEADSDGKKDDSKSESKDDDNEEKSDDSSSDGGDDKGTPDTSDEEDNTHEGYEKPGANAPGQINYKPGSGKGPGEGQKGPRKPTETKGEKDSASDKSGAKHPYLDDDEKSKKGEGLKETAKIHGTVDSNRPLR